MKANLKYAMILKINVKKELILHTRKICPNPLKLKNIFLLKISFYFSITVYIHLFVLVSSVQLSG